MGNRAVIAFGDKPTDTGIYLHWNGGRASVEAFLGAAKELGVRANDGCYMPARLCQIIGNWFGGALSLGVGPLKELDCDNHDNGMYIIDGKLNIIGRRHNRPEAEETNAEKTAQIKAECVERNAPFFKKEFA